MKFHMTSPHYFDLRDLLKGAGVWLLISAMIMPVLIITAMDRALFWVITRDLRRE